MKAAVLACLWFGAAMAGGNVSHNLARKLPANAPGFAEFVDRYLDQFAKYHPSIAAGNGIHDHDAELEDFSARSVAAELKWLRAQRRALDAFDPAGLSADERVDRRILQGIVDGWVLDLDSVRTWSRNPMIYVAAVSDGVHDLVSRESAPPGVRMQRIQAKLEGIPRLLAAARRNVRSPPKVFVERAIAMLDGVADLLQHDLPLAFTGSDAGAREALMRHAAAAQAQLAAYRDDLQSRLLPIATGNFRVGTANVEARYRAEELIDTPAAELLRIGMRELEKEQSEFVGTAAKVSQPAPPRRCGAPCRTIIRPAASWCRRPAPWSRSCSVSWRLIN